mgnify:CR=1 FL=1
MNHPHPDELLLFASGELAEMRLVEVASHLGTCATCQNALAELEGSLVALDRGMPRGGRPLNRHVVWTAVALATAAVLAAVLLMRPHPTPEAPPHWMPTTTWSLTAGYVTGGRTMMDIDAQLTRLEQGWSYGRP